jgi:hypothetical protein
MFDVEKLENYPKEIGQILKDYPALIEQLKKHTALESVVGLACGWAGNTTMTLECFFSNEGMGQIEDKLDMAEIEAAKIIMEYMKKNNKNVLDVDDIKAITHDYGKLVKQRVKKIQEVID